MSNYQYEQRPSSGNDTDFPESDPEGETEASDPELLKSSSSEEERELPKDEMSFFSLESPSKSVHTCLGQSTTTEEFEEHLTTENSSSSECCLQYEEALTNGTCSADVHSKNLDNAERKLQEILQRIADLKESNDRKENELYFLCYDLAKEEDGTYNLLQHCEKSYEVCKNMQEMLKQVKITLKSVEEEIAIGKICDDDKEREIFFAVERDISVAEERDLRRAEKLMDLRLGVVREANSLFHQALEDCKWLKAFSEELKADQMLLEEKFQYGRQLGILTNDDVEAIRSVLNSENYLRTTTEDKACCSSSITTTASTEDNNFTTNNLGDLNNNFVDTEDNLHDLINSPEVITSNSTINIPKECTGVHKDGTIGFKNSYTGSMNGTAVYKKRSCISFKRPRAAFNNQSKNVFKYSSSRSQINPRVSKIEKSSASMQNVHTVPKNHHSNYQSIQTISENHPVVLSNNPEIFQINTTDSKHVATVYSHPSSTSSFNYHHTIPNPVSSMGLRSPKRNQSLPRTFDDNSDLLVIRNARVVVRRGSTDQNEMIVIVTSNSQEVGAYSSKSALDLTVFGNTLQESKTFASVKLGVSATDFQSLEKHSVLQLDSSLKQDVSTVASRIEQKSSSPSKSNFKRPNVYQNHQSKSKLIINNKNMLKKKESNFKRPPVTKPSVPSQSRQSNHQTPCTSVGAIPPKPRVPGRSSSAAKKSFFTARVQDRSPSVERDSKFGRPQKHRK